MNMLYEYEYIVLLSIAILRGIILSALVIKYLNVCLTSAILHVHKIECMSSSQLHDGHSPIQIQRRYVTRPNI